uniref:G_PROTEIN_RECEP_F1_2 domain-containing protein n=1 Tax=Panagrellus redivivus TaxID=6233 RepID=A0A7E4VJK1_PANRE
MLLEMSIRMGSKPVSNDVREVASRRANRQQQRILLQISVIAVIFYSYMTTYYLVYYIFETENKWVMLFNSFFYSTTHMINPVIYFSLNREMRAQLIAALSDLLSFICCAPVKSRHEYGSMIKPSVEHRTSNKMENSFTETSPLFSSVVNNNRTSNFAPSATISKLQKESLSSAVLIDVANTLPPPACAITEQSPSQSVVAAEDENQNVTTASDVAVMDPEEVARAQEQRRSLLDALIRALTTFTNQFSEDEGDEVVAAVLQTHVKRFGPSKSTDFARLLSPPNGSSVKHSQTSQCITSAPNYNPKNNVTVLSPNSLKSPENQNLSELDSSASETMNRLIKSNTWQQWADLKRRGSNRSHGTDRDSLTMLLAENSLPESDEDDVIYL